MYVCMHIYKCTRYTHSVVVQDCIRYCLLRELTVSQLVAIATRSDTGSHNRLDLIQSIVPPHYVCNGYVLFLNSTLDDGRLYLATGTMPVSNDFPRELYLWHRFSRVTHIYFCQDLSPL